MPNRWVSTDIADVTKIRENPSSIWALVVEVSSWIESVDILHNFLFQRYSYCASSAANLLVENLNSNGYQVKDERKSWFTHKSPLKSIQIKIHLSESTRFMQIFSSLSHIKSNKNWKFLHIRNKQQSEFHSSNFETCRSLERKVRIFQSVGIYDLKQFWLGNYNNQASISQSFEPISEWENSPTWSRNSNDLKI